MSTTGPTSPGPTGAAGGEADAERDAWAVLASVVGLGPVAFAALLVRYGTAREVLRDAARPDGVERLRSTPPLGPGGPGRPEGHERAPIDSRLAPAIVDAVQDGPDLLDRIRSAGLTVVTLESVSFPPLLARIELPPHVLFVRGTIAALSRPRNVAVVGTRRPTSAGRLAAGRIATALVRAEATVVSGLAYGIDGAAHEATLRAGGTTVAVIGGGHERLGPRGHVRLADAIVAAGGAIVSEYAPTVEPTQGTFPRRNRIISGLSDATVVVEAPASSGALITASWALEQGRGCFVVPGGLDAPASTGCLDLLRENSEVRIVAGIPQLIADLGYVDAPARLATSDPVVGAALQDLGATERRVAGAILAGHRTVDELSATCDLPVAAVLATLALLERRRIVAGSYGRYRPDGVLLGVRSLPRTA